MILWFSYTYLAVAFLYFVKRTLSNKVNRFVRSVALLLCLLSFSYATSTARVGNFSLLVGPPQHLLDGLANDFVKTFSVPRKLSY